MTRVEGNSSPLQLVHQSYVGLTKVTLVYLSSRLELRWLN